MSLQGDLSTLDIAGLLQNLETNRKSGLLAVKDGAVEKSLYFHEGKLALISYPDRPSFVEILQVAGVVTEREMEVAQRRRKGTKRSLGSVLVGMKVLEAERLAAIGAARLTGEACELINARAGAFVFTEGPIPRGVFDPEERALGITLPAGPLLLEAARRSDHWALIREAVPSDSTHYVLARPPREPAEPSQQQLLEQMTPLLDGSRSVTEIVAAFPHRRFEAFQMLADLVQSHAIKVSGAGDMNRMIQEVARHDRARAMALLERGLESSPRNLDLLCTKALLAEELGELEQATEALKMAVHLQLESGAMEDARTGLDRLKELGPEDPFVYERSFELALEEGRVEDALADGEHLVELYREPGLFRKATKVLERMVEASEGRWDHVRALAQARADAGERDEAIRGLESYGQRQLAAENYAFAHKVYAEILVVDPDSQGARETLDQIKNGELARRKAFWRKVKSRALLVGALVLALFALGYEILARRAYVDAQEEIVRRNLLEDGKYAQALEVYASMRASYPWATVSLYDVRMQMAQLEAKLSR
jgi:tetratricopeptide (TPR) repeat protein